MSWRRDAAKAAALIALAGVGIALYIPLASRLHGGEREILDLMLAAYLILLSGPTAHYVGLPVALIELLMGVAAGAAGAHRGEALGLLGEIGANMVLFMAGAEIDVALLRKRAREAGLLALLILAGPATLVYSPILSGDKLLLAAALTPTSVAITYAILHANGLIRGRTGQTVLAAAMISDVVGMMALNISGGGWSPLTALYLIVLGAALLLYPIIPRLGSVGFEAEVRVVMMAVLVLGLASELIGIHSVLTSFILGVIVGETVRTRTLLREKLEGMVFGFFAPFFFLVSGLELDASMLARMAGPVILFGAAVYATKAVPAYAYLKLARKTRRRTAILYSSSLAPLLTVTVIAADTGLRTGLISEDVFTLLLGSVIVTTTLAGLISRVVGGGLEIPEKHFH